MVADGGGWRRCGEEYDSEKDRRAVEEVENRCEVGPSGKLSLYTDLLGDPICRVRHSPAYLMLVGVFPFRFLLTLVLYYLYFGCSDGGGRVQVAELVVVGGGEDKERREIVGMIRGCIKTVTCGTKVSRNGKNCSTKPPEPLPVYTKLAYILGLRVSPSHRRMGIGLKLVRRMEQWFGENGAEYSYMATETDNMASVKLFTQKCGYCKFRTPAILVQPVFAHRVRIGKRVTIIKLSPADAEVLYRRRFSTTEFFPRDIDAVLNNKLSLGTFLAVPRGSYEPESWPGAAEFLVAPPETWAVLSAWNCMDVFRLEVRGASGVRRAVAKTTRVVDRALPWLHLPSIPEVFRPFGFHFLYGLGGEGPNAAKYMRALCGLAHNLAQEHGCGVVATEVASREPLRSGIPHWKSLSCAEDLWCIKRLGEDYSDGSVGDWTKSPPGLSIFVDPREF
ncbi:UNVERIFIED_CONTAM: putative N-acetyltransferase HLS1-like [Sesamum calycinum]|uniref:N-acetyltransferase HLS1-like n=1 Tax=Sesamum calycinum TaxID=2727403 RepID=A0AAW2STA7_9LAMI